MLIVGINAWAGSGKDTAAELLIEEFGFSRVAYADPLKVNVARDFNIKLEDLHSQTGKEAPIRELPVYCKDKFALNFNTFMFREFRGIDGYKPEDGDKYHIDDYGQMFLRKKGDSMSLFPLYWNRRALCIAEGSTKRSANPDYWVEKAIQSAKESGHTLIVISDLRYKNEVAATKMAIDNENDKFVTIRVNRFETTTSTDPSERDLDDATFDYVIENKTTLEEYLNKVKTIAMKELQEVKNG
jgi:hypothetical protein